MRMLSFTWFIAGWMTAFAVASTIQGLPAIMLWVAAILMIGCAVARCFVFRIEHRKEQP